MSNDASLLKRGLFQLRHKTSRFLAAVNLASPLWDNLSGQKHGLIIIDGLFPNLISAFRIAEINSILDYFDTAVAYGASSSWRVFRKYSAAYPQFASRVRPFHPFRTLRGSGAYVIFLNPVHMYLNYLEKAHLPFVFELYPGGGFCLNHPVSDAHLRRVVGSPMFRRVIVTQTVTRDYLIHNKFCREDQIEFIYGVVVPSDRFSEIGGQAALYGTAKNTFDICFVAYKYTPRGIDKGYDRFVECARILSKRRSQIRFHVVGNFTEADIDVSDLCGRITFYGPQLMPFFPAFYSRMDLIISPNVPYLLAPGAFDGFPTACCIEAALCGVAMFVTDPLGLNEGRLKHGEDVVIVSPEPEDIATAVEEYLADPARLVRLAKSGQQAMRKLFAFDTQMAPRLRVLSDLLS